MPGAKYLFGTFRLLLAIGVIYAHMGESIYGIHTGITGVICFFMISGYAMTGLIDAVYSRPKDIAAFYADRFVRLAPQYYAYTAVCCFTVLVLGWRETAAQTGSPDLVNILANLTVIPLSLWMYSASIGHFLLNMPTWSLGLEASFYVVLPLMLWRRTILYGAAIVGAIVWVLSTQGVINPDYYAYRLLPGTLVFFLVGVAIQRKDWLLYTMLVVYFVANGIAMVVFGKVHLMFNVHYLAGAALGCVVTPLLALFKRNRIDDLLASVSYGTYLAHWIFVTALKHHYGQPWAVCTAIGGSVLCGYVSFVLIERPTLAYRRKLRDRRAVQQPVLPSLQSAPFVASGR